MKINIETIPHNFHRYPTLGDYWIDHDGVMQVRVSKMGDEMYEAMVIIHELVEFFLLRHRGVQEPDIMKYDIAFEKRIELGEAGDNEEPGFAKDCPYRQEHTLAQGVEMIMCAAAGMSWSDYDKAVYSLFK
jgi:hypothetical protein